MEQERKVSGTTSSDEDDVEIQQTDAGLDASPPCTQPRPQSSVRASFGVASSLMKNILGGKATSLHECIFVVIAGQLLAFNSGYINGACLSGFLVQDGSRQAVSAFTGAYTNSALQLADGHADIFWFQVCMILSFILGSFLTGCLTPEPTPWRIEPTYGPTFCLGSLFLLGASLLAAIQHHNNANDFVFYLAAIANGIQNGLSSSYSANLIRSTHLTGTSSDIGLFAGQWMRGNRNNTWRLFVLVALALSFWTGGFLSFHATKHFTSSSLLFNAGLFLLVGVMLVAFLVREHSITVTQALLGNWHWKRAMQKMSKHFDPAAADSKEQLMNLFAKVDADGSGTIAPDELLAAILASGRKVRMRDIQFMVKYADKDGDGVISQQEWANIVDEIIYRN